MRGTQRDRWLNIPTSLPSQLVDTRIQYPKYVRSRWLAAVDPHANEAILVARIATLERVKSAAAAAQVEAAVALYAARRPNR
ncbi:hypothetical protein [Mycobacterium leprae]|uniref:hypothetical protein n=1 Tax=Mycobacterium leprae TaxID=1769 RepID=UPI0002F94E2A|nr:hypothetical protein [Mycobacterium leprae]